MSERKEDWIDITESNGQKKIASPNYISNLLKESLGIKSLLERLDQLERARFGLQKVCLPQLIVACKEEMLPYIENAYPKKAFKSEPIRDKFDAWYGWKASNDALEELVKEGIIIYKRGWYRLANQTGKTET